MARVRHVDPEPVYRRRAVIAVLFVLILLAAATLAVDLTDPMAAGRTGPVVTTTPLTGQEEDSAVLVSSSGVNGVAFSPDATLLATAYSDGTVRLWDPATGHPVGSPLQAGSSVNGVAFSPNGQLLASADADGTVRLWDPATGHPAGSRAGRQQRQRRGVQPQRPTASQRRRRRDRAGVGSGHRPPGRLPLQVGSSVNAVAFSPNGQLLASADADGTVRLWDPATGPYGPVLHDSSGGHGGVNGVAFSPDGKLLASADGAGTVRLWDPATGHLADSPLQAGSSVNGVAFSPDGKLLASADADGTVRAWDPATGHPVGSPLQAGSSVNAVAFSPNGKLLISADAGGSIRAWNPPAGQPAGPGSGHWFVIAVSAIAIAVSLLTIARTTLGIRAGK